MRTGNTFLNPRRIAVIGASTDEEKMGHRVLKNIIEGNFEGEVYPINLHAEEVLGKKAYPRVTDLPEVPDLVVVATPPRSVPGIVEECAHKGVPSMIILTAGFGEMGDEGKKLEEELLKHKGKMQIIGPNCLGVMSPVHSLNATFASEMAQVGKIGVISQSGAILTAIQDWAEEHQFGFSHCISLGAGVDVTWHNLLYWLGADKSTDTILVYMESVGSKPRKLLSALREISARKRIIIIKPGRTEEAARAAASHTGSMTGSDEVFGAFLARAGVVRVETLEDLFDMAEMVKMPLPKGNELTIMTNAGGPAVLATDMFRGSYAALAALSSELIGELDAVLPPHWSRNNPIDIIGDATPDRYRDTLRVVLKDPGTNAVLVILTPQIMTDPTGCAHVVIEEARDAKVPVFVSWLGGKSVQEAHALFVQAGIPVFPYPDHACRMFGYLVERAVRQTMLRVTPSDATEAYTLKGRQRTIGAKLREAQRNGETLLPEMDAKRLLHAYGIVVPATLYAGSSAEAVEIAKELGYPVVLKLHSRRVTHKSDVGGVRLNLTSEAEVVSAFDAIQEAAGDAFDGVTVQQYIKAKGAELLLGATTDPQFGPVIVVGTGGTQTEVYRDIAHGFPPLDNALALRMLEQTKVSRVLLREFRGMPRVDVDRLVASIVSFSRIVTDHPEIKEIEINPLLVSGSQVVALDARIVLYRYGETMVPPAIRPYPIELQEDLPLRDGETTIRVRAIRPDDEPRIRDMLAELSDQSIQSRFQLQKKREDLMRHEELVLRCNVDYDLHMALVAVLGDKIVGVVRLIRVGEDGAEFSLTVLDAYHKRGIGRILSETILDWADAEGIERIYAHTTANNLGMRKILQQVHFSVTVDGMEVTGVRRRH